MEAKFCPQCGTKLKEDALFCSECGYKIKDKIGTEDLNTNTISKSEVPEIKNEGNKISCSESKKSISDYINWVDVVIEFDDHTYAHTVFDIDSYSSESLPIELDFEPSEGDTIKFNVTVKDISLFEDEDDDYDY